MKSCTYVSRCGTSAETEREYFTTVAAKEACGYLSLFSHHRLSVRSLRHVVLSVFVFVLSAPTPLPFLSRSIAPAGSGQ